MDLRSQCVCWAVLVAALSAGPSHGTEPKPDTPAGFAALEQRLLTADSLCIGFTIESSGALESRLAGHARLESAGDGTLVKANGVFAGTPVSLALEAAAGRITGGSEKRFDEETPPALFEALVTGLTRMGLLHNLAMLSAGLPPDRAAGGVSDWVQAGDLTGGPPDGPFRFTVVVAGQDSGDATLLLDEREWPQERKQTVQFPEGAMHVVESYPIFDPGCEREN